MIPVSPLAQLAAAREVLVPARTAPLEDCLAGDNFDSLPDPVLTAARAGLYGARVVHYQPVELVRLPPGAHLFGGRDALLLSDGVLVAEQVPPPNVLPDRESIASLAAAPGERVAVEQDCVLVSRFGLMTWGHWVGELLPRMVLAERAYPDRFHYVLPPDVLAGSAPRTVWNSIRDTIRLLGIPAARILQADPARHYVFARLHGVTASFADWAFHPDVLAAMRAAYPPGHPPRTDRRIALLRTESRARNISNLPALLPALRQRDYEFIEVGALPFQEQVTLFASASHIAGVLASGLTGLFFAQDRVRVLSFAPQGYINRFFYPIIQSRRAAYVDLRGPITQRDPRSDIFSDFQIDPAACAIGLDRLEQERAA